MGESLSWAWLLAMALVGPVGLPAGGGRCGGELSLQQRRGGQPLISQGGEALHRAPQLGVGQGQALAAGEPLRPLGSWCDPKGRRWLRVASRHGRGWLPQ
ncbi:MAG: SH3 domain-containing protein [Aphanocapsa feldmannii 277cV]|uniref:SH3 domain-containing protein n=2 Tax=Aphanocapsa feldmannii TaxID=192050 RepID=A0A524RPW6_9CHRO|nr:MAG: SH3 domain-containing protein [Aphanocapsa feldmannii 288cV]TGG94404.1 MAG: SH3 domain-containing protein [Aphanocapsa feldmannii 277cV]